MAKSDGKKKIKRFKVGAGGYQLVFMTDNELIVKVTLDPMIYCNFEKLSKEKLLGIFNHGGTKLDPIHAIAKLNTKCGDVFDLKYGMRVAFESLLSKLYSKNERRSQLNKDSLRGMDRDMLLAVQNFVPKVKKTLTDVLLNADSKIAEDAKIGQTVEEKE